MSTIPPVVIKSTTKTPDGKWEVTTTTATEIVAINTPPSDNKLVVPSNAKTSGWLDNSPKWKGMKDAGTPGAVSKASDVYLDKDHGRQFTATQTGHGGYRWSNQFGSSLVPTNFVYDLTVKGNWLTINQLELDMNHVLENSKGATKGPNIFLCIQASMGSKSWEYTLVSGGKTHWYKSNIPVNIHSWAPDVWKHIRLKTHHDENGIVTYEGVEEDGVYTLFDPSCKGSSVEHLDWDAGHMLINYQINGSTASESTMNTFAKNVQVQYW